MQNTVKIEDITKNRFVAFIDILGFKEMILKNAPQLVYETVMSLHHIIKTVIDGTLETMPMDTGLTSVAFSDSIFIFSDSDSPSDLLNIIHQLRIVLAVCYGQQIPIKGALSFGSVTIDTANSIFFGEPVSNAYELHNDLQMFGMILDHNFEKKVKEFSGEQQFSKEIGYELIEYKTSTKHGDIMYYNVLWPSVVMPHSYGKCGYIILPVDRNNIEKFYTSVTGYPRAYVQNTIDFIDYIIEKGKRDHPGIQTFQLPKRT